MKRAALYIRVSTLEQAKEGYSIGEQKERLIAYCKAKDWVVAQIYVDGGYTGSNINRPGIQQLIEETNLFDLVLVYKLDRLSRSQRDTLYLIEEVFLPKNVDFISMQESFDTSTPFGKAMIGLLAVFAQLEREQIKERTWMGRVARAKKGLHNGASSIPIGYDYDNGKLIINPYEAEHVRFIFKRYLAGDSLQVIHARLKEMGVSNKYGSYNHWSTIRSILKNKSYIGAIHFRDIVVENAHAPIISREDFDTVQMILEENTKKSKIRHSFKSQYLLTGMLFCGHCGARYSSRVYPPRNKNGKRYAYYMCYSRSKAEKSMIKDPNCKNTTWTFAKLEGIVEAKIREMLTSPDISKALSENSSSAKKLPKVNNAIGKKLKELDKRISKLMDLYQIDDIPTDVLGEKINALHKEKTALLASQQEDVKPEVLPFDLAESLLKDAAQVWDFADLPQKRRILQSLISRIVLTDSEVNIEWKF